MSDQTKEKFTIKDYFKAIIPIWMLSIVLGLLYLVLSDIDVKEFINSIYGKLFGTLLFSWVFYTLGYYFIAYLLTKNKRDEEKFQNSSLGRRFIEGLAIVIYFFLLYLSPFFLAFLILTMDVLNSNVWIFLISLLLFEIFKKLFIIHKTQDIIDKYIEKLRNL